jgi:hypothetical protein
MSREPKATAEAAPPVPILSALLRTYGVCNELRAVVAAPQPRRAMLGSQIIQHGDARVLGNEKSTSMTSAPRFSS